jgi:hypothetical protein
MATELLYALLIAVPGTYLTVVVTLDNLNWAVRTVRAHRTNRG